MPVATLAIIITSLNGGGSSNSDNKLPNPSTAILSFDEVQKNFNEDGQWFNKTYLTSEDLSNYHSMNIDAFDNLENHLEYVELPSNLILNNNQNPLL